MNIKRFILIFLFALFLSYNAEAQSIDRIRVKCRPPNQSTFGNILAASIGDLIHTPCSGRASIFNGNVDFTNATIIGSGFVSGTGTTNFIPRWTNGAGGVIGNTPSSWNGTLYSFNNTALTSEFRFDLTPETATGAYLLGDNTTAAKNFIRGNVASEIIELEVDVGADTSYIAAGGTAGFITLGGTKAMTLLSDDTFNFGTWSVSNQFAMKFTPSTAAGLFKVGDYTTTPTNFFILDQATNTAQLTTVATISNQVGDAAGVWNVTDATNFSLIFNANTNAIIANNTTGSNALEFDSTSGTGFFKVGDYTATPTNFFILNQTTGIADLKTVAGINIDSGISNTVIGDVSGAGNNVRLTVNDLGQTIELDSRAGETKIGDVNGIGNLTTITLNDAATSITINSTSGSTQIGGISGGNGTVLDITDGSSTYTFGNTAANGVFNLSAIWVYQLLRTLTPSGTTGAQVIDKPNGTVNFAIGPTSLVVTNSQTATTSTINAMAQTNDATCSVKNVVPAAGSFTINMTAACTAETAVAFWVYN